MLSWSTPTVTWGKKVSERGHLLYRYRPQLQNTATDYRYSCCWDHSVCVCLCCRAASDPHRRDRGGERVHQFGPGRRGRGPQSPERLLAAVAAQGRSFLGFFSSPGFWGLEPSRLLFCLSFLLSNKRVDLVRVVDQTAVGPSKGATMSFPGV